MLQNSTILVPGGTGSFGHTFIPMTLENPSVVRFTSRKKIPSMKMTDLARVIAPEAKQDIVGIRPGEKLHEQMIGAEDSYFTYEYPEHFKILPNFNNCGTCENRTKDGTKVPEGIVYASDNNTEWMTDEELQSRIGRHYNEIGKI